MGILLLPLFSAEKDVVTISKETKRNKRWIRKNLDALCPKVNKIKVCATEVARDSCQDNWNSSVIAFEASARMVLEEMTEKTYDKFDVYENGILTDYEYLSTQEVEEIKSKVFAASYDEALAETDERIDDAEEELEVDLEGGKRHLRVRDEEDNNEMLARSTPKSVRRNTRGAYCERCLCCKNKERRGLAEQKINKKWKQLKKKNNFYLGYLKQQCDKKKFAITYATSFTQILNDDLSESLGTASFNADCFKMKNYTLKVADDLFYINLIPESKPAPIYEIISSDL